ncbi:hypothetical protein [Streptomyces cinerochromogenes]|uniref:hypothetical protein n=1 Tax=Streptomyces cinerochromogenes TaxID=66422 RepID=UPI001670AFB2|nr:hypothetical protein [Streptomyces cinerochromogenes]GGS90317.1 hypothetical protein GCM10010206_61370 [Streptomyces cinerochromogenes]
MALAFRVIRFDLDDVRIGKPAERREKFYFEDARIRRDYKGNRAVDVAIKSFDLVAHSTAGAGDEFWFGRQQVSVDVNQHGHQDGEVTLSVYLRPSPAYEGSRAYNITYSATVEALVIAELEGMPDGFPER